MRGRLSAGRAISAGPSTNNPDQTAATGARPAKGEEIIVSRFRRVASWLIGVLAVALAGPAEAQGNLDAGKTPAQIFASTCTACHRRPQELKRASAGFLRSHYMTGPEDAAAMAGYLAGVGSDPRAVQERDKKGAPGAGRTPPGEIGAQKRQPPAGEAKASQGPAGSTKAGRRAGATAEVTRPPAATVEEKPPEPGPAPAAPKPQLEEFEE
jgi:hypothetical protein